MCFYYISKRTSVCNSILSNFLKNTNLFQSQSIIKCIFHCFTYHLHENSP